MLSATVDKRLEALPKLSKQGKRINGLFRLMESPKLWLQAYANLYPNKGAITKGVDGVTMDGFSDERVANLMALLKEDRYLFQPVRRAYIPKENGKTRPLGIPSGDAKLVQEVVRLLLERIYEPIFSEASHGFRPKRSCHTALEQIRNSWHGAKWIVEMDIQGFYDNMDHVILIQLLEKKIDDPRFINLIKGMLRAGFLEDWVFHGTYSGTPQGGPASPILSNVYLHELDQFMAQMKASFDRGKRRAKHAVYTAHSKTIERCRRIIKRHNWEPTSQERQLMETTIREQEALRQNLPAGDPFDPDYRRLLYCRYADDFRIGIIGSKADAVEIKRETQQFLEQTLKLNIAEEKSGIHYSKEGVRFLGYEVRVYTGQKRIYIRRGGKPVKVKSVAEQVQLHIPKDRIRRFVRVHRYGEYENLKPIHKPEWLNRSDVEIILAYNAEMRGFANYYSLATLAKKELRKLYWLWQRSLLKTLAAKHKTSVAAMVKRLRRHDGLVYKQEIKGRTRTFRVFTLKELKRPMRQNAALDRKFRPMFTLARTELIQRLAAERCEYCGQEQGYFEIHHVRKLKDLKGKKPWEQTMAAMRRKTMVLCIACHQLLHQGRLPDWRQRST